MYKIDKRPSGYVLTFSGNIGPEEMQEWVEESQSVLQNETRSSFGVIVNMTNMEPMSIETSRILVGGQQLYKDKGMVRSAVILDDQELYFKLKNTAIQSGIFKNEKYILASEHSNPVDIAIKWVNDAIDPEQ